MSLGFRGNPKATGRDIARPILNSDCAELRDGKAPGQKRTRQELKKAFDYTKSKLESSSIVLLSSEAFSIFSSENWECFSHFMGNGACLSAVVLHRGHGKLDGIRLCRDHKRTRATCPFRGNKTETRSHV